MRSDGCMPVVSDVAARHWQLSKAYLADIDGALRLGRHALPRQRHFEAAPGGRGQQQHVAYSLAQRTRLKADRALNVAARRPCRLRHD